MKILKVVLIYTKSSYKWYMLKYDKVICTFLKKWCRNGTKKMEKEDEEEGQDGR